MVEFGSFAFSCCFPNYLGSTPFLGWFIWCLYRKASNLGQIFVTPNISNNSSTCLTASCSGKPHSVRVSIAYGRRRFLDSSVFTFCSSFPVPRKVSLPLLLASRNRLFTQGQSSPCRHSFHIAATVAPRNSFSPPLSRACLCCSGNLA